MGAFNGAVLLLVAAWVVFVTGAAIVWSPDRDELG